jgi:HAD superfamily hydrolase (TIGR01490 family)
MIKLAFFDFCETLVNFQTADAFVDYVRISEGRFFMRMLEKARTVLVKTRIIPVFNKFFPRTAISKRMKLYQLRGISYERLDSLARSFYFDHIETNLIAPVVKELNDLKFRGFEICLVSAGYSIYLKYFAVEHHVNHVLVSEIGFNKKTNRCNGVLSGKDCIGEEKVKRIEKYFNGQSINFSESFAYSDSISDLPLLLIVGKGILISRNNSQTWNSKFNFREIIWHQ